MSSESCYFKGKTLELGSPSMNLKKRIALLLLLCAVVAAGGGRGNLLLSADGNPLRGWNRKPGTELTVENGSLRIVIHGQGQAGFRLPLPPDCRYLLLNMKMRATGLIPGKESWRNGRMAMRFYNKKGEGIGEWPNVFSASGTQKEFVECRRVYAVPAGAAVLRLDPGNFGTSGNIEFADVCLKRISPEEYGSILRAQIPFGRNLLTPESFRNRGGRESLRLFWSADRARFQFRFLCLRRLRHCLLRNRESNCVSAIGSGRRGSCGES